MCEWLTKCGGVMESFSISTTYKKKVWNKFIRAIDEYKMINDGDKIAVCISGGKDSMLLAKCMQELYCHNDFNFELVFLVMNPGFSEENMSKLIKNAKDLSIPITVFETDIFKSVEDVEDNPCFVCARMRRGYLYRKAKELGCNKIALGHHFNDVIETVLMGILYGSQFQTMMPKLKSTSVQGMEVIRPLYFVEEEDIIKWQNRTGLLFLNCSCKVAKGIFEKKAGNGSKFAKSSKRQEIKELIKNLKESCGNVELNIFNSTQNVNLNTIISYTDGEKFHSFLDDYDKNFK